MNDATKNQIPEVAPVLEIEEPKHVIRIANGEDLKQLFAQYPNASVRKLAANMDFSYGQLLKASKAPVPGLPYDPEATNWDAMANALAKANKNFLDADWEAISAGRASKPGTLVKDMELFTVGKKVYLRRDNTTPYLIVYKTDTHVVIQLEGSSEPQVWAHQTFLFNGPVFEPRLVKSTTTTK